MWTNKNRLHLLLGHNLVQTHMYPDNTTIQTSIFLPQFSAEAHPLQSVRPTMLQPERRIPVVQEKRTIYYAAAVDCATIDIYRRISVRGRTISVTSPTFLHKLTIRLRLSHST